MDKIIFNKQEYPVREMHIKDYGIMTISTSSLNKALIGEDEDYANKEAQYVDEQIFFFVTEEELKLSNKELSYQIRLAL